MLKKYSIMLLLCLINIVYAENKSNLKFELEASSKTSFGLDDIASEIYYLPPILKLTLPDTRTDYIYESAVTAKTPPTSNKPKVDIWNMDTVYKPYIDGTVRDVYLAIKYLSTAIRTQNNLDLRLSSDKIGVSLYANLQNSDYRIGNIDKFDKIKLGINSNNKYLYGDIHAYIKGNSNYKYQMDLLDREKELNEKAVSYNLVLNPFANSILKPKLSARGVDRYAVISPEMEFKKSGFYISAYPSFRIGEDNNNFDLRSELLDLKYTAPGYNKTEYFKNWELKEGIEKKERISIDEMHELYKVDLDNAKVSGYLGTDILLNTPSGSLYGNSAIKLALQKAFNELKGKNKDRYKKLNKLVYAVESEKYITLAGEGINLIGKDVLKELEKEIDPLIQVVSREIYEDLDMIYDRKESSVGIWNQINNLPKEFVNLTLRDFNLRKLLNGEIPTLDTNKLYMDELSSPVLYKDGVAITKSRDELSWKYYPYYPNFSRTEGYALKKSFFYFPILTEMYVSPNFSNSKFGKSLNYLISSKDNIGGTIADFIFGPLKNLFGSSGFKDKVRGLRDLIINPYEDDSLNLMRAIYFHNSEKRKNENSLYRKIKEEIEDIDLEKKTEQARSYINLNLGYDSKNFKTGISLIPSDYFRISNEKYDYLKNFTNLNFYLSAYALMGNKHIFSYNSNLAYNLSSNKFDRKDRDTHFNYTLHNISIDHKALFDLALNSRTRLELGLRHLGQIDVITNPKIIINGKEYETTVALRDEKNNPIGLDGNSIVVNETTELNLIKNADKFNKNSGKDIPLRDVNASDFIKKDIQKVKEKSIGNVYNILEPSIKLTTNYGDNFAFINEIKTPISFEKERFSGFNLSYRTAVKYTMDDKEFINSINKYKFNYSYDGYLKVGTKFDERFKYALNLDFDFISIKAKGINDNLKYDVALNPLVINSPVKPIIKFGREYNLYSFKMGLGSKNKNNNVLAGILKPVYSNEDYFKTNIEKPLLHVLKNRNKNRDGENAEYVVVKEILDDYKFTLDKSKYDYTPFLEIESEVSNIKYHLNASILSFYQENDPSLKRSREKTLNRKYTDNSQEKMTKNSRDFIVYNPYAYIDGEERESNLRRNRGRIFVVKKNNYDETSKITRNLKYNKLDIKKYSIDGGISYDNKLGLNIQSNLKLNYDNSSFEEKNDLDIERTTKIEEKFYALFGKATDGREKIEIDSEIELGNAGKSIQDEVKDIWHKNKGIYRDNYYYYCKTYNCETITEYYLDRRNSNIYKLIQYASELNTSNLSNSSKTENLKEEETNKLTTKIISAKLGTDLSYKLKFMSDSTLKLGLSHNLDVVVTSIGNIYLEKNKLFASTNYDIKNELTPNLQITKNLFENFSLDLKLGMPIKLFYDNDKELKRFDLAFELGYSL